MPFLRRAESREYGIGNRELEKPALAIFVVPANVVSYSLFPTPRSKSNPEKRATRRGRIRCRDFDIRTAIACEFLDDVLEIHRLVASV